MAQEQDNMYDAVVVGGGPAGLTAALYLARARCRVVVVERESLGGQITITNEVVNYPGVPRTSGKALAQAMRSQAASFGAEFLMAEATGLDMGGDIKTVHTTRGDLRCFAVLLATGASPRAVGFAGEKEFQGHGVAYCATCDGEFFTGKDVFVVGGGFAAAEESVFLTAYARHVTVMMRRDDFSCAAAAAEPAKANPKITILPNTEVDEVSGDTALRRMAYHNNKTGERFVYEAPEGDTFGVFVLAGRNPVSDLARGLARIDPQGYIEVDGGCRTATPGLFAAGDVCPKGLRQVATAVGQAAEAADGMSRLCAELRGKTGVAPEQPGRAEAGDAGGPGESGGRAHVPPQAGSGQAAPEGQAGQAGALFDEGTRAQLRVVFARMASRITLELHLDGSPAARELEAYADELAGMTDKVAVARAPRGAGEGGDAGLLPYVSLVREDGAPCGMRFHGVPGGHEFTSFVLGLYNAAGPGQPLDGSARAAIAAIGRPVRIGVIVSLTCTMCPDLVQAADRIAALNPLVQADVYDVARFPALKERYNVMSVPCLVVADEAGERVSFGRKTLEQLLAYIG